MSNLIEQLDKGGKLFLEQVLLDGVEDQDLVEAAKTMSEEEFKTLFATKMEGLFKGRLVRNDDIFIAYMNENRSGKPMQQTIKKSITNVVYERVNERN